MTSATRYLKLDNICEDFFRKTRRDEGEYPLWYLTEDQRSIAEKRPQICKALVIAGYSHESQGTKGARLLKKAIKNQAAHTRATHQPGHRDMPVSGHTYSHINHPSVLHNRSPKSSSRHDRPTQLHRGASAAALT